MTPFVIDLRPSVSKTKVAALAASAVLSVVAGLLVWRIVEIRAQIDAAEALIVRTTATSKALEAKQRAAKVRPPYWEAMNELVQVSTFPLNEIFDSLERVDVPGVRLVELKIDASQHQATALVDAASAEALQAYLGQVGDAQSTGRWEIQEISSHGWSSSGTSALRSVESGSLPEQAANTAVGAQRVTMVWVSLEAR